MVLVGSAGAVVAVAGLRAAAGFLGSVVLALVLTIAASPLTRRLRRLGCPPWLAVLATVVASYGTLALLGGALVVSVVRLVEMVPAYHSQLAALHDELSQRLTGLGIDPGRVREVVGVLDPGTLVELVRGLLGALLAALSNGLFLVALVLFMAIDAGSFQVRLRVVAARQPLLVRMLLSFARGTRRYLLVTTGFGLAVAVVDTVGLWVLGIPLPLLWGLLAFITNYIPNVGFVVGLVPPALLALLVGGAELMVVVVVGYCLVNFVIQSIIQPKIVGDAVGLSVTVSFLSLIFWGWVLGPLGALLAIPLSLLTKGVLVDVDPRARWVDALVRADPRSPTADEDTAVVRRHPGRVRRTSGNRDATGGAEVDGAN